VFQKTTLLATTLSLSIFAASSCIAYAGAMPDDSEHSSKQESASTLDQALKEIHGQATVAPVPVQEPVTMPIVEQTAPVEETVQVLAEPVIKTKEPVKETPTIVPDERIVQVQPNSSFFGLSVGLYDAFTHDVTATAFNIEWQPGVQIAGFLQPLFGAMITTDGSLFGYGGFGVPLNITDNILLMPSAAVGYYNDGDGYDLGQNIAYRFGTELAYKLKNKSRIGINAHIITNGDSLDKEDRTEVISLVYTTPLNRMNK